MQKPGHATVEFPKSRLATLDFGKFSFGKHLMYSLLEVDVTEARSHIRSLKRSGNRISFTSWMIKVVGEAAGRNPLVHALPYGKRRLVTFEEVDIALPVERTVDGKRVPLALRIASVNRKPVEEIEGELSRAREQPIAAEHDYVLNENRFRPSIMTLYYLLPQRFRVFVLRRIFRNPFVTKRNSGTVAITTVNAVERISGWMVPTRAWHNLLVALGSVNKQPWVVGNQIVVRDILHLTLVFNHDVVDGVPARRFVDDLVRHIERPSAG